jgi:hypothetical protein
MWGDKMKLPIDKLFEHGLYGASADKFEQHRKQQIVAGFEEYGKTYNPANFTAEEQLDHFMSELPDIMHYGYGMYRTIKDKEQRIAELEREVRALKIKYGEPIQKKESY